MQNKPLTIHLHAKSDILIATTITKSNATANSSSTCLSSPEAPIPKNISHGPYK